MSPGHRVELGGRKGERCCLVLYRTDYDMTDLDETCALGTFTAFLLAFRTHINHSSAHYCNAVQLSLILTNRSERFSNNLNPPFVFLSIAAYFTTIL